MLFADTVASKICGSQITNMHIQIAIENGSKFFFVSICNSDFETTLFSRQSDNSIYHFCSNNIMEQLVAQNHYQQMHDKVAFQDLPAERLFSILLIIDKL